MRLIHVWLFLASLALFLLYTGGFIPTAQAQALPFQTCWVNPEQPPKGYVLIEYRYRPDCPQYGSGGKNASVYMMPFSGLWICNERDVPPTYQILNTTRDNVCSVNVTQQVNRYLIVLPQSGSNSTSPDPPSSQEIPDCFVTSNNGSPLGVKFGGEKGDLVYIYDGRRLVFSDITPARDARSTDRPAIIPGSVYQIGSKAGELGCQDVAFNQTQDIIAIRLGWKNDIVHLFKFIRDSNRRVTQIAFLVWAVRDGSIGEFRFDGRDVLFTAGEKSDIYYRLCSTWQNVIGSWGIGGDRTNGIYLPCNASFPDGPWRNGFVELHPVGKIR